ncbi:MAG: FAD-dependent monooxygenase [Armatimonadetes bacterium]|nr:FAD-dependent monooxygenase [Armatimonadota bacterium]
MIDVVVVGAGPAGSAAAAWLAAAGCDVWLLERAHFPRPKPCGEFFNPGCVRELAALGAWPQVEAASPQPHRHWRLVSRQGRLFTVSAADLGVEATPAFALSRERFDAALAGYAVRCGARLLEGWNVRGPLLDGRGRVVGVGARVAGRLREVRARVVIAADGPRSVLARHLNLLRPVPRYRRFGLVTRYETEGPAGEPALEMHLGPTGGYCGLAWQGPGIAHLAMVVPATELSRKLSGRVGEYFTEALARYPLLGEQRQRRRRGPVWTTGPIAWRTRRQAWPGLLLVGDAAGFYDPFTGQGITFALHTARLAAEATLAALARPGDDWEALRAYERQRAAWLRPKIALQVAIQAVLARPWLAERAWERLGRRPSLATRLLAATADVVPVEEVLNRSFLAALFA